ncbi:MAG: SDR family oxidoreductase [Candidatus Eisenbacteria bacterium]|uniref:SDR family oxidoreductase n=1 Tax=Eiseniibacteriota bacterium TaxID=2212470 RepID=A0A948RTK9_UNCEI|nr:SDR family oxidoreductase [Candidatus Eisenbacteria bacterium]MBU2689323.1 SDR family oxidoreductase [Candidatus Eisenbacteria bacterium]
MTAIETGEEARYLLTGATGFLGSHIMAGLLSKGKSVVIAGRPADGEPLKERIRKLLNWFGMQHPRGLLETYEIDFLESRLGLGENEYERLCGLHLNMIHCASDTSFSEKNRDSVMKSNVESLNEIMKFAIESRARSFHFISTAYAAGTGSIKCPEAVVKSGRFTNVYEESKAHAEHIVSEKCREGGIPYTIMRPSIVYGDSVTGRALKFKALYYPIRSLQQIRDIYLDDIKFNHGMKSTEFGIYMNDEGGLHLPIRIFIPNEGKINLIPVDYFAETVLTIIETPVNETIYHITSNSPESMFRLAAYAERFLNITGIEIVIGAPGENEMRNPPEELFDHFIKAYRPYISDKRIFARDNTDRATGGALPPDFNYEIFKRCMDFAVSAGWGKGLFC